MDAPQPRSLIERIRQALLRRNTAEREGPPSFARQLGQIGILGWIIIFPTLAGLFGGRWLDYHFGSGIFWTAPLMMVGLVLGLRWAWSWMHRP